MFLRIRIIFRTWTPGLDFLFRNFPKFSSLFFTASHSITKNFILDFLFLCWLFRPWSWSTSLALNRSNDFRQKSSHSAWFRAFSFTWLGVIKSCIGRAAGWITGSWKLIDRFLDATMSSMGHIFIALFHHPWLIKWQEVSWFIKFLKIYKILKSTYNLKKLKVYLKINIKKNIHEKEEKSILYLLEKNNLK